MSIYGTIVGRQLEIENLEGETEREVKIITIDSQKYLRIRFRDPSGDLITLRKQLPDELLFKSGDLLSASPIGDGLAQKTFGQTIKKHHVARILCDIDSLSGFQTQTVGDETIALLPVIMT
jgi:hypothetical protein